MNLVLKSACLFTLLLHISTSRAEDNDKTEIFCDKLEMVKGKDILATTDFKVEKTGPTTFIVNGNIEHFKEFNDDWTLALKIFKADTADGEYRFLINYPPQGKKGACTILKNEYKKYFYDSIKECSNAPHFETCPLKEAKYTFDKCSFDANVFKKFLSKGYYIIKVFLSHLDENDLVEYDVYAHVENDK